MKKLFIILVTMLAPIFAIAQNSTCSIKSLSTIEWIAFGVLLVALWVVLGWICKILSFILPKLILFICRVVLALGGAYFGALWLSNSGYLNF